MGRDDRQRADPFHPGLSRQRDHKDNLHGHQSRCMLQGPAIGLYKEIQEQIPLLYLIASGGVSSIQDIEKLAEAGIPAVIFGKAIYEGKIQLKDLIRFT